MLDSWTFEELNKLIIEFKTLQSLRMLRDDADSARPSTSTLGEQLLEHANNYGNLTITFKVGTINFSDKQDAIHMKRTLY